MSGTSSQRSRVAVGLLNASGYAKGFNSSNPTEMIEATVLTDTAKTYAVGQDTSTGTIDMLLDNGTGAGSQIDTLSTWRTGGTAYPITLAPFGFSAGSIAQLINGLNTELSTGNQVGQMVPASANWQGTGAADWGVIIDDFTAITVDTNGTARDGGAATSNGGVAHLHVSAFSGLTSDAITIEHSVNGWTGWATLVTFTTATATTSQRVEVAAGTSVRQYLRVVDDVTGTGSITRLVAFARR